MKKKFKESDVVRRMSTAYRKLGLGSKDSEYWFYEYAPYITIAVGFISAMVSIIALSPNSLFPPTPTVPSQVCDNCVIENNTFIPPETPKPKQTDKFSVIEKPQVDENGRVGCFIFVKDVGLMFIQGSDKHCVSVVRKDRRNK